MSATSTPTIEAASEESDEHALIDEAYAGTKDMFAVNPDGILEGGFPKLAVGMVNHSTQSVHSSSGSIFLSLRLRRISEESGSPTKWEKNG